MDHVRDRHDADVYLYVASESAGGAGGTAFTLAFEGQGRFDGLADTLTVATPPEPTYAEARATLTRAIEMGLMRYVARTEPPGEIRIAYAPPEATDRRESTARRDPWNAWVFSVGVDATAAGEETYQYLNLGGSLAANRTTEEWKVRLRGQASRFEQRFEFEEGDELTDRRTSYSLSGLVVNSLGAHWSVGATGSMRQSTRSNTERDSRLAVALESNLFPYADASHRELTFLWEVGANAVAYQEETIYDQTSEVLVRNALTSRLNLQRPWGFVGVNLSAEQVAPAGQVSFGDYIALEGQTTYDLSFDGIVSLNLVRGLSFDVSGGYAKIGNQRYLPKGGATPEEVLLRRKELETAYRFDLTVGLNYTFGSIYNNVVNPRF